MNIQEKRETNFQVANYPKIACKTCKQEFVPRRQDQVFCSASCCNRWHNRKRKSEFDPVKKTVYCLTKSQAKPNLQQFESVFVGLEHLAGTTQFPQQIATQILSILKNRELILQLLANGEKQASILILQKNGFDTRFFTGFSKKENIAYLFDVGFKYVDEHTIQPLKINYKQ